LIVGKNVGGNQAWIPLGSFRLQPSEFAKLASCLMLAKYLNVHSNKNPNFQTLIIGSLLLLLPVGLIMLQPDTGSALAFFALIFVFYREGYVSGTFLLNGASAIALFIISLLFPQWTVILGVAVLCALIVYFTRKSRRAIITGVMLFSAATIFILGVDFVYNQVLQSHQRNRIEVLLGKIDDPRGE